MSEKEKPYVITIVDCFTCGRHITEEEAEEHVKKGHVLGIARMTGESSKWLGYEESKKLTD